MVSEKGCTMAQIHKQFSSEQVKVLFSQQAAVAG